MAGKILLIAYSYPPLQDPQSIRWFNLSNLLAEYGYKIDVITIKLPDSLIRSDQFKLHHNINIFRIFPGFIENIAYGMKSKMGTDSTGNLIKRRKKGFRLIKYSYRFVRKIMDNMLIGDLKTEWLPFCLNFLKRIDINNYSALITSQEPFVDSLIGMHIKKKHPNIRWIVDMGDSILSPYYPAWRKRIDRFFERKIVKTADRIVLTNQNLLKLISRQYGLKENKFCIINQGFSIKKLSTSKPHKNRQFTLFFSGTFYKSFREPDNLIKALSQLDIDYHLMIAGRNELFLDKFSPIAKKTEFLGFISYFESLELQKQADILINIGNKQLYQVPGKFFEYLGSGRPILNIVYDENDETAKLTRELNAGVVCKNSAFEIRDVILRLYNLWKNEMLENSFYFKNTIDKNHCKKASGVAISNAETASVVSLPRSDGKERYRSDTENSVSRNDGIRGSSRTPISSHCERKRSNLGLETASVVSLPRSDEERKSLTMARASLRAERSNLK